MGRQWEDDGDVMEAAIRILVVTYSVERMIQTVRGTAMEMMRRAKPATTSGVSGLPCAAEFTFTGEAPIGHVEPVDSSAMIPPEQVEAVARAGE